MLAGGGEDEPRAGGDVSHRLRHEDLARVCERSHTRADVHGDSADAVRGSLDLTCMAARSHFEVEVANGPANFQGTLDGARRLVEGDEESIARGVDLAA